MRIETPRRARRMRRMSSANWLKDVLAGGSSAPEALERLIRHAERSGASDIHLQMLEGRALVSFRLDGILAPGIEIPAELGERLIGRIKYLARLKTYQESMPQDGRIDHGLVNATADVRVATYPTVTGEKVVLRLFAQTEALPLADLGLAQPVKAEIERFLGRGSGLLLLTGPAGSGKTTTIYGCLKRLADVGGRHIITVEDPAERVVPGVMQTEVNEARGLTFGEAARHLLRQDPQALMVGEIRDEETANLVVRAALTGHMVISTLHAGSCRGVLERLLVLCSDVSAVASALELLLNQRLVRKFCGACRGRGCDGCMGTGFRGRLPVVEMLRVNDNVRDALIRKDVRGISAKPALAELVRELVAAGLTSSAEVAGLADG